MTGNRINWAGSARRAVASLLGGVVLSVGVALSGPAQAQSPNEAAAEALFDEGRALFDAGNFAEACVKFEESQRLDPSPGTLLNLARCNEAEGKTASAWSAYLAARRAAQAAGRELIVEEATRRAADIERKLSFLTVRVERPVAGLEIHRGAIKLTEASFGVRVPTDPGEYQLRASAPGYVEWVGAVELEDGGREEIVVPELQPAAPAPAPAEAPLAAPAPPSDATPGEPTPAPRRVKKPIVPLAFIGSGVLETGVGLVFGALADNAYDKAEQECPQYDRCSDEAMSDRKRAGTYATTSTVLVAVGAGGIATGAILWAVHGKRKRQERRLEPAATMVSGGGVAGIRGRF